MRGKHFITGATGFVGSYILIELLKQCSDPIYCLVRPKKNKSPQKRLFDLIESLVPAYQESSNLIKEAYRRIKVIEGDLQSPLEYLKSQLEEPISIFWHVAASLNYEERLSDQIFATNLQGTRHALNLAQEFQVDYFNYFSTAYVAGKQEGLIREEKISNSQPNNTYEKSKLAAENIVLDCSSLKTRIFRPSVVVGHSQTNFAFNFSGLYGFLRRLLQFKNLAERSKEILNYLPLKLRVDPDVLLNLVPVDLVAHESVRIGLSDTNKQFFNLTNPVALTVGEGLKILFELTGLPLPKMVESTEAFSWIDQKFNQQIQFYQSYLTGNKHFDRQNTNSVLDNFNIDPSFSLTANKLRDYCMWYLDTFNKVLPAS